MVEHRLLESERRFLSERFHVDGSLHHAPFRISTCRMPASMNVSPCSV